MFSNSKLVQTRFGLGVAASRYIAVGEIVWEEREEFRNARAVFPRDEVETMDAATKARLMRFAFELPNRDWATAAWVGPWVRGEVDELPIDGRPDNGEVFNHSCDPNCWWQDDFTLLARRPIEAGELFTYDYATEDLWDAPFQCECGTEYCRGRVTSQDYKRADLRARYGRMWKSHILELIDTVPPDPASHSMHLCAGDASQQAPSACDAGDAGACDGMAGGVTGGVPKEELRWAGSKPSIEVVHLDAQQVEASASDRCSGESDSEGSTMEARHGIIDERESDHEVRMRAESHPRRMSFGWGTDSKPEQGSAAREGAVEPVSS